MASTHIDREVRRVAQLAVRAWRTKAQQTVAESELFQALMKNAGTPGFQEAYYMTLVKFDKEFRESDLCKRAVREAEYLARAQQAYEVAKNEQTPEANH